jgi:hypothetical protein
MEFTMKQDVDVGFWVKLLKDGINGKRQILPEDRRKRGRLHYALGFVHF